MGCSTSTQTSAVDTSRPSAKPEEINGATLTGAANENGNVAEDSETIPDQTPALVANPADEPVLAAACTESTVEAVPAEKELQQHADTAAAAETAAAPEEATPTETAAAPEEATPTETAAAPAEATPTEAAAAPAEAAPTETSAAPAEAAPTETSAAPAEAAPTETQASAEAPAAHVGAEASSAAPQQGTDSEPRTEEAPAPSD